ncbi:MAG: hypothetical protein CL600_03530 [Alteromonas sp.]|nr:hypothetical protein [Alteromonas sp.]
MSDLLHIVKGFSQQPKRVLALGARSEAMLTWLFSLTDSQVVLVEPELAMFEKANALYNDQGKPDNVSVVHGAPAFESDQEVISYFVSSMSGFSSALPPNFIQSVKPALEFKQQEVPAVSLKAILQQYNFSENEPCLLIAQLNGGEQHCLNSQVIHAFTHVVIQSTHKPVYGENKPIPMLKKQFEASGRDYIELAEAAPPYSNLVAIKQVNNTKAHTYFDRRQEHREIKEALESQLRTSKSETKKVSEELQQAKQQVQTAKQQAEEKQKQLNEELQQAKQQLQTAKQQAEEKQKQLSGELQQAKQQLQTAKQQAEEKQKQLSGELQQASQQLKIVKERNEQENAKYTNELNSAEKKIEELTDFRDRRETELKNYRDKFERELVEREKQIEVLFAQIGNAKETEEKYIKVIDTTSKLNLKLQCDLDELRERFSDKVTVEKELTELIHKLYVKLKLASEFYCQLDENNHN